MNKKKNVKFIFEVYGAIGQSICACAGGIVGFILGGPLMAIPGIFIGSLGAHLLERSILKGLS